MEFRVIRIEGYDVQIQVLPRVKLLGVTIAGTNIAVLPVDRIINAAFHQVLDSQD